MTLKKTFARLREHLKDTKRDQDLSPDNAFAFWFTQATLLNPDDITEIKFSVAGGSYDKGVDIICWSDLSQDVYLCQCKYRHRLMKKDEDRAHVKELADWARLLNLSEKEMLSELPKINSQVRDRVKKAHKLINNLGYGLKLMYVTTGKISSNLLEEAQATVAATKTDSEFIKYDGSDCCRLFEDFDSLVPTIPNVELDASIEALKQEHHDLDIHLTTVIVPVVEIWKVFHAHGERLFARNIRLGKGEKTETNKAIRSTLKSHPEDFLFLNNGITIIGESCERRPAVDKIKIKAPQIINGQQTTRAIGALQDKPSSAKVIVRIIHHSPSTDEEITKWRKFIRDVVRSTNLQNAVSLPELCSNDKEHIDIDRALRLKGWEYVRKVGKKKGATGLDPRTGDRWKGQITLMRLVTAMVACHHDPQYIRKHGVKEVFNENNKKLYNHLLASPKRRINELLHTYLIYYLSEKKNPKLSKPENQIAGYGKYFVAYRLHDILKPIQDKRQTLLLKALSSEAKNKRNFDPLLVKIKDTIHTTWRNFYKDKKEEEQDVNDFTQKAATKDAWNKYWRSMKNAPRRKQVQALIKKLKASINAEARK